MIRVVIESPLGATALHATVSERRAAIAENQRYARRCVVDSLARAEAPYAAHLFYHHPEILDDLIPGQRAQGLQAGLFWATQAEICAVYLDRGFSSGMRLGVQQAVTLGMRVSFRFLDRCDVWALGEATALACPGRFSWSFRNAEAIVPASTLPYTFRTPERSAPAGESP